MRSGYIHPASTISQEGITFSGSALALAHQQLHDLSQPVTTLLCQLELAEVLGSEEAIRDAVHAGLREAVRIADGIKQLRETLNTDGLHNKMEVR